VANCVQVNTTAPGKGKNERGVSKRAGGIVREKGQRSLGGLDVIWHREGSMDGE